MRLLITGATGTLGTAATEAARHAGLPARRMSRRPQPDALPPHTDWAQANLVTGDGLRQALDGITHVLHAATATGFGDFQAVDIEGTRRLLDAARSCGVEHVLFPSIVGTERIPLGYYQAKALLEKEVLASGVPATVVRATQFHAFVAEVLARLGASPVMPVPSGFRIQSIAVTEAAAAMIEHLRGEPAGRTPDLAGPEVMTLPDMARTWAAARGKRRLVAPLPLPGGVASAFKAGHATNPDRAVGTVRWADWLRGSA